MLVRVLTLRFNPVLGGFDDRVLSEFLVDKELIGIVEHFFEHDGASYLALVIKFNCAEAVGREFGLSRKQGWREMLQESELGLFGLLREWRTKKSQSEGVPPFVLFTNLQLAQIVKTRPQTASDFLKIPGLGRAKLDKYGAELLAITKMEPIDGDRSPAAH